MNSSPGEYFITICVHNRQCIFGEVIGEEMRLNDIGKIAAQCWGEIPKHFLNVTLDEYVIMPNHIHGIIVINERRDLIHQIPNVKMEHKPDVMNHVPTDEWMLMKNPKQTLGKIVRYYKAQTTKFVHDNGYSYFRWQSRFYEHIIRNEKELHNIQDYILNNPLK